MDIACYQSSEMKLGPIGCEVYDVDQTEYCLNIVIMQRTTRVAGGLTLVYVCIFSHSFWVKILTRDKNFS